MIPPECSPPPPPDPIWAKRIQIANTLMQEGFFQAAKENYLQALDYATALLGSSCANPHTVHLVVISCHNLADSELQLGSVAEASRYLWRAHQEAINRMNDSSQPLAFRWEAMRALWKTLSQIKAFLVHHDQSLISDDLVEASFIWIRRFLLETDNWDWSNLIINN